MFQYAAARALSIKDNSSIKIDISGLREQQMPFRQYTDKDIRLLFAQSLGVFDIDYHIASNDEVKSLRGWGDERNITNKIIKHLKLTFNAFPKSLFQETLRHGYDPSLLDKKGDIYLDGLFINPRYFNSIEQVLRKDFTFKVQLGHINSVLARDIVSCNSVSIHVRRGDLANPNVTGNIYPVYGLDYYDKAIAIIRNEVSDPHFYIFSDDPEWVSRNLDYVDNSLMVTHNPIEKGYADLWLMCQCRHNIITNSTFSWWGAWLNKNPAKVIVCPDKWRNDDVDTSSLFLEGWRII